MAVSLLRRRFNVCAVITAFAAGVLFTALLCNGARADSRRPLLKVLLRFEAADVPPVGPAEAPVPPLQFTSGPPAGLPGASMSQHPMLYIGEGCNTIFVVNHGRIVWTYSTGPGWEFDDAWMLSNGNVLFTRMQYVAEVTPEKQVVWHYDAPLGTEIHCCQPIGLKKVLFIENGLPPHLKVVDIKSGNVDIDHVLPCKSLTDRGSVHAQFRRVRYTANGHYLIPFLEMDRVVEYDRKFNEVWSYDIKSPWAAVRLKNGNTLITDESEVITREVDPNGATVWELKRGDIPDRYWYGGSQSCTRLSNGNTIICSRGSGNGPQLVEVTPEKRVVWVLQDWQHFGPATAVQILDEPGVPEKPGDLAR